MDATQVELLILDVDGVLTDGRLITASEGEPAKAFHAQDGCAIKLWRQCGGSRWKFLLYRRKMLGEVRRLLKAL